MNSNFQSRTVVIKLPLKIRKCMLYLLASVNCFYAENLYNDYVYIFQLYTYIDVIKVF